MPPVGSCDVSPGQGGPFMAFHPVQPVLLLLMASVLPFLLRQLRIIAGDDARLPVNDRSR
jgi:hypothetical protein